MKKEEDMKSEALVFPEILSKDKKQTAKNRLYLIAFAGSFGGMLFIFVGFIFLIIHSLIKGDSVFDEIGTTLMFLSFPMLFLGGHFMDKASEKQK